MAPDIEWLRRSRTLLYDAYWPPFYPRLDYDPGKGIAIAKKLNANAIRFGTIGKWALFPSKIMPQHPNLGGRDLLGETVTRASKNGIKIIGYIPVAHGLPGMMIRSERPQWAFLVDDGTTPADQMHFGGPGIVPLCTFGAYRQDILEIVREVVNGYDVSAIYLDGPYQGMMFQGICQCAACKEKFSTATGKTLPSNAEAAKAAESAEIRERIAVYHSWVGAGLAELMAEIRAIALTKNLPLLFNVGAAESLKDGRWQRALIENSDGFLIESRMGGVKGIGRGVSLGKIVWSYTHNHSCWPRRTSTAIESTNALSASLSVARGATPIVSYGGRFLLDDRRAKPLIDVFATMTTAEPLLTGSVQDKHCALISDLDLQPTDFWAPVHKSHDRNLYAAYEMLKSNQVQTQVLSREALSSPKLLADYAILCLPSVNYISDAEAENIRAFVRNGGGLVATGITSLLDEKVKKKTDYTLSDVFGASVVAPPPALKAVIDNHWWSQAPGPYDIYLQPRDVLRKGNAGIEAETPLMVGEFEIIKALPGAEVAADLVFGTDYSAFAPACVINSFGKGKSVFIPAAIEETFESHGSGVTTSDPDLARLLSVACRLVSKRPDPFKIITGNIERIFANASVKPGVRLLHLVDQQPRGETLPATVAIYCPEGRPTNVYAASTGKTLAFRYEGDYVIVDLTFARYECVIIKNGGK